MHMVAQHIARGAWLIGDDGHLIAHEFVQQAGFAGIGLAGDDDVQTFAQQRALARGGASGLEALEDGCEPVGERGA